jgi:hypothetical protein
MAVPLSVDDAFTVGVSFDLLGGFLLGRGLLARPLQIAVRNTHVTVVGSRFNAAEAVSQIQSRADASAGLVSLAIGFLLQAGGYVALVAGAKVDTGLVRGVLAVVLALAAAAGAFLAFRRVRDRLVLRLAVEVARANPFNGRMDDDPDITTLLDLSRQLGFPPFVEVTDQGTADPAPYLKEHFGVDRVSRRYPFEFPAPGC